MKELTPATYPPIEPSTEAGSPPAWDRLGVFASVACAVHCLAAPLLFLAAPALGDLWAHPLSHALIALLVLPLAASVLWRGYRTHRKNWIAVSAVIGMSAVLLGCALPFTGAEAQASDAAACASCCLQVVEEQDGGFSLGLPPASIATLVGSFFLVACHLGNLTCCRFCKSA